MTFRIATKTQLLLKALNYHGYIMTIDHISNYVPKLKKSVVKHHLCYLQPTAVYNFLHPNAKHKRNPKDWEFTKVNVCDSYRDIDILSELVRWMKDESWNKDGITYGIPPKIRTEQELRQWLATHPQQADTLAQQGFTLDSGE